MVIMMIINNIDEFDVDKNNENDIDDVNKYNNSDVNCNDNCESNDDAYFSPISFDFVYISKTYML